MKPADQDPHCFHSACYYNIDAYNLNPAIANWIKIGEDCSTKISSMITVKVIYNVQSTGLDKLNF